MSLSMAPLFIRGEKSDYIRDSDMELIREYFPSANLETVAGAGHWVHYEAPKPFIEKVFTSQSLIFARCSNFNTAHLLNGFDQRMISLKPQTLTLKTLIKLMNQGGSHQGNT